jgi:hypothetical protein
MAISKWLALVSTIALTGCCVSGNGCYAPTAGTPIAWDGLGSPPFENADGQAPARKPHRSREIIAGNVSEAKASSDIKSESEDRWAKEQAAAAEADRKLTRKLKICSSCE